MALLKVDRTLVIMKPDAIERNLVGEIKNRFSLISPKLEVARELQMQFPKEVFADHYSGLNGKIDPRIFENIITWMSSKSLWYLEYNGENAAVKIKEIAGKTDPKAALPGTIRGDFGIDSLDIAVKELRVVQNLIHTSDPESAEKELKMFFEEMFEKYR